MRIRFKETKMANGSLGAVVVEHDGWIALTVAVGRLGNTCNHQTTSIH
jgi:hypothetical protein